MQYKCVSIKLQHRCIQLYYADVYKSVLCIIVRTCVCAHTVYKLIASPYSASWPSNVSDFLVLGSNWFLGMDLVVHRLNVRMYLGNVQAICSIVLQKCIHEAAGCNKSAYVCVYEAAVKMHVYFVDVYKMYMVYYCTCICARVLIVQGPCRAQ